MTLPAGTRLGPYEILSPLGAGGMEEVYPLRRNPRFQKLVAGGSSPTQRGPKSRQFPQPAPEEVPTGNYMGSH
jgi:hypothetical protein